MKKDNHMNIATSSRGLNHKFEIHSGMPRMVDVHGAAKPVARRIEDIVRRVMDVAISGVGLVVLAPLFAVVAFLIKKHDGGPVLFRQDRVGKDGKVFSFYKFRSMVLNADALKARLAAQNQHGETGITFKIKNDPRITPVGRFIRKFSIDELPQLYNVLKGDMAIVGPRPAVVAEVERYDEHDRGRLAVRPGLTCYWQIMGRAELDFAQQVELDLKYIAERSLINDVKIMLATPRAVIGGRGAY
jgi:lipopolysaccharide/colanic/teichoic acid biosynthesis glycosyltransferase